MFFDMNLMGSKCLGKVWRLGHGLNEMPDEEQSMTRICEKLDSWVDSIHDDPHRRLSLRTSSVFIDGAARLYKRKLDLLFEDTQRLERDMCTRKKFRVDSEFGASQTFTEPEFQETTTLLESEFGTKTDTDGITTNDSHSNTHTDEPKSNATTTDNDDGKSSQPSSSDHFENTTIQKTDKSVQTSPKPRRKPRSPRDHRLAPNLPSNGSFNENLPFGYVVVHDNYQSRIPSRIIVTSLNPDIRKLV